MEDHPFWKDKPVGTGKDNSPISMNILAHLRSQEIPKDAQITEIESEDDLNKVIQLINEEYISTPTGSIRLIYPPEFIKWYIFDKSENSDSVLIKKENEVIGFVHGKRILMSINKKKVPVLGINFLCVRKFFRKQGVANILIEEITKKGLLRGFQVGVFTGSKELSFQFCEARFFHRPINLPKLIDIGYLSKKIFFAHICYFDMKKKERHGTRRMEQRDLEEVNFLMQKETPVYEIMTIPQLEETFLSRNNKVFAFVYENKKVKEFFSFYEINSVYENGVEVKCAYLYYWASLDPEAMINDCLVLCKKMGFDVLNCLNVGGNCGFLGKNGFLPGTGRINYYFYNFNCSKIQSGDLDFVMY